MYPHNSFLFEVTVRIKGMKTELYSSSHDSVITESIQIYFRLWGLYWFYSHSLILQSLFLFRVQFLVPRYLSDFHVEEAGHYQERRKVMRTVPVSDAFSLGSHRHQKRQTFRRNKDKALDKEMVWTTLCPPAELFVAGCVFWLSVRSPDNTLAEWRRH